MSSLLDVTRDVFIDFGEFRAAARRGHLRKMPRFQDVTAAGSTLRASASTPYKSHFFISHRWDDPTDPDPTGWQFEALTQFAAELEAQQAFPSCFWFDFSCLPQAPRTSSDQLIFDQGLSRLNGLSVACDTIVLVSGVGDPFSDLAAQLKRGWILCEVLVAHRCSRWKWWFHQTDTEIFGAARARTADFNHLAEDSMRDMPVHDPAELLDWLNAAGVACTNNADLAFLASRMVAFSFDINRQSGSPPPALDDGVVHYLSDEQVARYFIDSNGRSPYFPASRFAYVRRLGGGYDVTVVSLPSGPRP
jgi:hypothetical protein